ncbi:ADAM10 [Cordylochernes scorpioides]|uniref:ADAM10 n=1 Tax=Cordylochernes scorpioides TaxID=51811 RepID=A0ABY6KAS0_9ARAC|nr:ADAM10 [Cordylochernes scorpioides]
MKPYHDPEDQADLLKEVLLYSLFPLWPRKLCVSLAAADCLTNNTTPFCGNGVVEAGEECDCGSACQQRDHCCLPRFGRGDQSGCQLVRGTLCSSRQPCCTDSCDIVAAHEEMICRTSNTPCMEPARCNGKDPECPPLRQSPDGTECEEGMKTCRNGTCSSNICFDNNLTVCCCSEMEIRCELCCETEEEECRTPQALNLTSKPIPRYSKTTCAIRRDGSEESIVDSTNITTPQLGAINSCWFLDIPSQMLEDWPYLLNILLTILVLMLLCCLYLYRRRRIARTSPKQWGVYHTSIPQDIGLTFLRSHL